MSRASLNLGIASAVFLILLAGYGVWYASVRNLSAESASLADQIAAKEADASRAAAARRALGSIQDDQVALASHFVSAGNVVSYLEELGKSGQALGAKVSVGSVSAEEEPHAHLALSVSIKGTFDAVMRTLGAIEYGPIDAEVSNATVSLVPGDADTASSWSASVTMSVGMESTGDAPAAPAEPSADESDN